MENLDISSEIEDGVLGSIELFVENDLLASSGAAIISPEILMNENPTRTENFFEITIPGYTFDEFRKHFRMSRSAFAAFREKSGGRIPGIIGAIDGCHIQIKQPLRNPIDYYNRKNSHSDILQVVCDHRVVFTDVYVGAPGRLHDARVFRNSPLSSEIDRLVPDEYHLVGDTAYPLKKNLVPPFRDNGHLSENKINFNTRLSSARVTIERAFGFLKCRFRHLKYLDVSEPMMANKIVTACCILHNHIQIRSHEDFVDADIEVDYENPMYPDPNNENMNERGSQCQKRNYLLSLF
ncbi:putative nuclease HARBI1 [Episyrphus balteatus]|uniref:putative nuclease HARBI1 n=1 Tax=Episyrphus balteatus TaxID=286459 RepID=UPI002486C667|nr:putative nuclease HARBI1 [Episyrphus balteatus]